MLLSILIPTLESRERQFARIHDCLSRQVERDGLSGEVEILWFRDRGENPVGFKRNALLERARGEFVAFVDDDDEVSADYVARIVEVIRRNREIDCIGIRGAITFRGRHASEFVHSLRYTEYFSRGHRYYRPPYHLNPIRRSIASRYRFAEVNYSEDIDWAMRIARDGALAREEFVDTVLYYYHSRRWWPYQWLLDVSEPVRHRLGLRFSNRLRHRAGR